MTWRAQLAKDFFGIDSLYQEEGTTSVAFLNRDWEPIKYCTCDPFKMDFLQQAGVATVLDEYRGIYLLEMPRLEFPEDYETAQQYVPWFDDEDATIYGYYRHRRIVDSYPDVEMRRTLESWAAWVDPHMKLLAEVALTYMSEGHCLRFDIYTGNIALWHGELFPFDIIHNRNYSGYWQTM